MVFSEELKDLKMYLVCWFGGFFLFSFFFFSIGYSSKTFSQKTFYFPVFSTESFSIIFFETAKKDLIPSDVLLVASDPITALTVQTKISLLAAFVCMFPYLLYLFFTYLSPALYIQEKKILMISLLPSVFLFAGGALFSYRYLIPLVFKVLFSFNVTLGVTSFFNANDFINWVLALIFIVGTLFQLPVLMCILSLFKIVHPSFWHKYWKIATLISLGIFAIIIPDVSGIAMIGMTIPMLVLYMAGTFLSNMAYKY